MPSSNSYFYTLHVGQFLTKSCKIEKPIDTTADNSVNSPLYVTSSNLYTQLFVILLLHLCLRYLTVFHPNWCLFDQASQVSHSECFFFVFFFTWLREILPIQSSAFIFPYF